MIEVKSIKNGFLLGARDFQSLNSKGFGIKNGNNYELNSYEVLFLLERKKIKVISNDKKITEKELISKKNFDYNNFIVYRDLKTKGYNVKSAFKYGFAFRVYDKGIKLGEDHSLWLVDIFGERDKCSFKDLAGKNRVAHTAKKKMLLAVVDDEGSVTYLENSWKRVWINKNDWKNIKLICIISSLMWMRFFIPVLALFYIASKVSLDEFTIIMSVFALSTLILEILSGVIADIIGKKKFY